MHIDASRLKIEVDFGLKFGLNSSEETIGFNLCVILPLILTKDEAKIESNRDDKVTL